MLTDL